MDWAASDEAAREAVKYYRPYSTVSNTFMNVLYCMKWTLSIMI